MQSKVSLQDVGACEASLLCLEASKPVFWWGQNEKKTNKIHCNLTTNIFQMHTLMSTRRHNPVHCRSMAHQPFLEAENESKAWWPMAPTRPWFGAVSGDLQSNSEIRCMSGTYRGSAIVRFRSCCWGLDRVYAPWGFYMPLPSRIQNPKPPIPYGCLLSSIFVTFHPSWSCGWSDGYGFNGPPARSDRPISSHFDEFRVV